MTFLEMEQRFEEIKKFERRWMDLDLNWDAKRELANEALRALKVKTNE